MYPFNSRMEFQCVPSNLWRAFQFVLLNFPDRLSMCIPSISRMVFECLPPHCPGTPFKAYPQFPGRLLHGYPLNFPDSVSMCTPFSFPVGCSMCTLLIPRPVASSCAPFNVPTGCFFQVVPPFSRLGFKVCPSISRLDVFKLCPRFPDWLDSCSSCAA